MIELKSTIVHAKDAILPPDYKTDEVRLMMMMESIKSEGLIHNPILRDDMKVVTGKLRIAALKKLNIHFTASVCPSNLKESDYKAIALHENLKRHNMTWQEQVLQEKELHELRKNQIGETPSEAGRGKRTEWGLRDTAKELDIALGVLSEDLRIADAIMQDPSLMRVDDKTTARRIIFERIKRSQQENFSGVPVSFAVNEVYCGDSGVILQQFPNDIFDVCLTDPPWLEYKDAKLIKDEFTLPVFKEVFRVLKQNSFLYAFVSTQDWYYYQEKLAEIGFTVQKYPLIWAKEGVMSYGRRSWEYHRNYEFIILAAKGSPALAASDLNSVMTNKVIPSALLKHPNEKPIELIKKMLAHCSYEQGLVLDPFAGSFVVPAACKLLARRYIAIERDHTFFLKGQERLK